MMKGVEAKGLQQKVVSMKANPGDHMVEIGVSGHEDHGAIPVELLRESEKIKSAGSGHTDIGKQDVEVVSLKRRQDAMQIVGRMYGRAVEPKRFREGVPHGRFVVDY